VFTPSTLDKDNFSPCFVDGSADICYQIGA
jgi:hypothetical protein